MNWDAISAVAETAGTIAVLVTLVYLSIQMRIANKQREIESLRHKLGWTKQYVRASRRIHREGVDSKAGTRIPRKSDR